MTNKQMNRSLLFKISTTAIVSVWKMSQTRARTGFLPTTLKKFPSPINRPSCTFKLTFQLVQLQNPTIKRHCQKKMRCSQRKSIIFKVNSPFLIIRIPFVFHYFSEYRRRFPAFIDAPYQFWFSRARNNFKSNENWNSIHDALPLDAFCQASQIVWSLAAVIVSRSYSCAY